MPQRSTELNIAQEAAAYHGEGPLLIVAGPGTGKTRVLSHRIAYLIEKGAMAEEILALTFSNKAATEMYERTDELLGSAHGEIWISTFHAYCARLLREQAALTELDPFFEPITDGDRLALLLENLESLNLRHTETLGRPAAILARLIERIDRCKDELVSATEYRQWAESLQRSASSESEQLAAAQEIEFADVFAKHDQILREAGAVDFGEVIVQAVELLKAKQELRDQLSIRHRYILVDEYQDTNFAQAKLLQLLASKSQNVTVVGDDDQSIYRFRGASEKNMLEFERTFDKVEVINLEENYRSPQSILDAGQAVVAENENRLTKKIVSAVDIRETEAVDNQVQIWRCESERSQAQAVATRIEELITVEKVEPEEICVLVKSVKNEGGELAVTLAERDIPYKLHGSAAFFNRSEIRDVLAWLRVLLDPSDSPAVMRTLARQPIDLHSVDQARLTQLARKRKLSMVQAANLALDSSDFSSASRDQLKDFLSLYKQLATAFNELAPPDFVRKLLDLCGLRKQQLFRVKSETVERLLNLQKVIDIAVKYLGRRPKATSRDFAQHTVAVADAGMQEAEAEPLVTPSQVNIMTMHGAKGLEYDYVFVVGLTQNRMPGRRMSRETVPDALLKESLPEDSRKVHEEEMRRLLYVAITRARRQLVLAWPERSKEGTEQKRSPFLEPLVNRLDLKERTLDEQLFGPREKLYASFQSQRDQILQTVATAAGKLKEMRLDTYLDVNKAVVEYLELLKIAALIERSGKEPIERAIGEVNELIKSAINPNQRELFERSDLDHFLTNEDAMERQKLETMHSLLEPSLDQFLPKKGESVMLSATDIETYRSCPLKYKFARVYGVPQDQTMQQRFGILIHQVLERYHSNPQLSVGQNGDGLKQLEELFQSGWRRSGLGGNNDEKQLYKKAVAAIRRYYEDSKGEVGVPTWFERSFSFNLGKHRLRGRVDRIDRLPNGSYELIDYKTGRPRTKSQLAEDIQLSLYQLGASEAWGLEETSQSYYYFLDGKKVPVQHEGEQLKRVQEIAEEVANSILEQKFDPTPAYDICSWCSFQMICPAAEK